MIELTNFHKKYGDFTAVECLNLKIEAGELFGFIGPNGAGKSTSIRFLATLLKATSGDGEVNGYSVNKQPLDVRRSVGYMPDNFGVYDGMKVWEFLDFFAVAYQIPRGRRKQVIGDVLELLDLTHKRDDFVNGLSRGMKQRLCLAKTLVHDPPVLILDEPSSGLDPRARLEVKALLKELRRMGKTILISSHILSELADCCTSIGIIERGKLLMHGPIDEVYRRIRSNRIVEIKVLDRLESALSIVRSRPETLNVQTTDHTITAELAAEDEQLASLMEQLLAGGVRMRSFGEKDPTLEDVFMLVTKGLVT
ncbi:MAG: ABC transporter ATP-binding protein [Pirellulales bacterium]|nr:ABC transporter ATP-binding protein [Pirellulales bacterium]